MPGIPNVKLSTAPAAALLKSAVILSEAHFAERITYAF
jgi:hypothetical protein